MTTAVRNRATVAVRRGPLVAPVLSRVVGMLAARAQCPIDRLDDALLVADAISAHAPGYSEHERVCVAVLAAELPGVGNVLRRVADDVHVQTSDNGHEHLIVRLGFAT